MSKNGINERYILPKHTNTLINNLPRSIFVPQGSPLINSFQNKLTNILSEPEFVVTDFSRPLSSFSISQRPDPCQNINRPTSADNKNISNIPFCINNQLNNQIMTQKINVANRPKFESPFIQKPPRYGSRNIVPHNLNSNSTNSVNFSNNYCLPNLIPIQNKNIYKGSISPDEEQPLNLVKPNNQNLNLITNISKNDSLLEKNDSIIDYSIKIKNDSASNHFDINTSSQNSIIITSNFSLSDANVKYISPQNFVFKSTNQENMIYNTDNLLKQNSKISPLTKSISEDNFLAAVNEFKFESRTNTESYSSLTGNESDTSIDEEDKFVITDFVWHDYLDHRKATAAPSNYFIHVEYSLKTEFKKGMRLEVLSQNDKESESYWPASILMVCGQLLRLRPDGGPNNGCADFWCDVATNQVRSEGWALQNNKNLSPPNKIIEHLYNWETVLHNYKSDIATKSNLKSLKNNSCMLVIDNIIEGMVVEVQLDKNPLQTNLATIIKNIGGRLLLKTISLEDLQNCISSENLNQYTNLNKNNENKIENNCISVSSKNHIKTHSADNLENFSHNIEKENSIFEGSTLDYFMKRNSLSILDDHLNSYDFNQCEYLNKKVENIVDNQLNADFLRDKNISSIESRNHVDDYLANINNRTINCIEEKSKEMEKNLDFWMFYLDPRLHCIGWANDNDLDFIPYSKLLKENKVNDWSSFIDKYEYLLEKGIPCDILDDQEDIPDHEFTVGMKLEFLNTQTGKFHLAIVNKVFNVKYFSIRIIKRTEILNILYTSTNLNQESKNNESEHNGIILNEDSLNKSTVNDDILIYNYDDISIDDNDIFICSNLSLNIFPVGWCKKNFLNLENIEDNERNIYDNCFKQFQNDIAPSVLFYQLKKNSNNFCAGTLLEVVNIKNKNEICVATIDEIKDTLLFISFDHDPSQKFILPYKSFELFPVGWSDCNNWPLITPLVKIKKKKVPTATLR